jgi:pteridine reductase
VEIRGRVALVTGAGRRVGRAIALGLAKRGARLAIHYHSSSDGANDLTAAIQAAGGEARTFLADLSVADAATKLVNDVADSFGRLDVLINSAGIMERTPVGEVTAAVWDRMFAINLRAPFFAAQAAAARMGAGAPTAKGGEQEQASGVIVNISDLAGLETWPAYVPHGITKAGIIQMTRSLAHALAPRIRVNAVAPGAVLLPEHWSASDAEHLVGTTPLHRLGSPDDVVGAVNYLLDADYVTGTTIVVDGGRRVRV